ncbi:MAG: acetyltransferase, partial [Pseudomonadota bacterium]
HELGSTIDGHEVGFERVEDIRDAQVLVTVGNNGVRARLQARAEALGLHITTYTSHRAHLVTQEELGAGSVVLAGAVVNWAARLGKGVIIGSAAVVEHDAQVDDFVHVSPGAVLAGGARVGKGCFIGVNASVVAQVTLADGVTLGAGAVAVEDLREPGVYAGSPARRVD